MDIVEKHHLPPCVSILAGSTLYFVFSNSRWTCLDVLIQL